jgi:hypothetical protein
VSLLRSGRLRMTVERLVNGDFRPEDVSFLFLSLRERSYGVAPVTEIGHFVAHPSERTLGIITGQARDFFARLRYSFSSSYSVPVTIKDVRRAVRATLRDLTPTEVRDETGIKKRMAGRALESALGKMYAVENGRVVVSEALSQQEDLTLRLCLDRIVVRPAFTDDELYAGFLYVLERNRLLKDRDKVKMLGVKPGLTLFAVSAMHGVHLVLDGLRATLEAQVVTSGMLHVVAYGELTTRLGPCTLGSAMFSTSLRASDWCDPRLLRGEEAFAIRGDVTVTADQKLTPFQ